jgi:hypothetical protein
MTEIEARKAIRKWFRKQLPEAWFVASVEIKVDRDEILVVGRLDDPGAGGEEACMIAFREATRDQRVGIAQQAEQLFGRKVSWAVVCGEIYAPFSTISVPVMTRLRIDEREILDTLVGAGVARSRSDALGWCVRLVAEHEGEWLAELQTAVAAVEKVRSKGPE